MNWRTVGGALLAALLLPATAAEIPAAAESACADAASPALAGSDPEELRRRDPAAALAAACAGIAARGDGATRLDLALALIARRRFDEAQALLEAAGPGLPSGDRAWALGRLAAEQERRSDALRHFADAQAAWQAEGGGASRRQADALVRTANALVALRGAGDLERAGAALDRAETLLDGLGLRQSREMADLLEIRTVWAYAMQDLDGAVGHARRQVALVQAIGGRDDPALVEPYSSLGAILSQQGRFAEARAALEEGIRVGEASDAVPPDAQLGLLTNLAALHLDTSRNADALAVADRALAFAVRRFGDGSAATLTPLNTRGLALMQLSRFGEAQAAYERAREVARAHAGEISLQKRLRLADNLASLYLQLGDADAVRAAVDEGLALTGRDGQLGYWRGRLLRFSAALSARRHRWAEAEALQAEAGPLIGQVIGEHHPFAEQVRAMRCTAQVRGRLAGTACDELQAELPRLQEAPAGLRVAIWLALAEAAEAAGERRLARTRLLQALAAAESAGIVHQQWVALDALARQLRAEGEPRLAVAFGKQAIERIEAVRGGLAGPARAYEASFFADKLEVYRRLADWLTEDGRLPEALEVLRLLKDEEFYDFVRGDGRIAASDPPGGATAAESLWWERWRRLAGDAADDAARVGGWNEMLAAPAEFAAGGGSVPRAAPPLGGGDRGALHAYVYPAASGLHVVTLAGGVPTALRLPVDPGALARDVGRVLAEISRRGNVLPMLQAMHATLGRPIEEAARRAGATRLVLHVDGVLRYLPFAALHDGRGFLGERYAIEMRAAGPRAPGPAPDRAATGRVAALGVTRPLGGMAPLKAVADEVCGIVAGPVEGLGADDGACAASGRGAGAMPGEGWLNEAFTIERLGRIATPAAAGPRNLLHVGTHFALRPGHMGRSWLMLGDGRRLTLDELAAFDLSAQQLVTLSACETGLGGTDDGSGGEVEGLAALMMRRGAGAVVASLWRVEDASTSRLMQALYRELRRGATPARALQRAQAALRRAGAPFDHPFYWAGFFVAARENGGAAVSVAPPATPGPAAPTASLRAGSGRR